MKKILSLFVSVALLFSAGCASTNSDTATVVSTLVVYNGAYQVLKKNPSARPQFEEALAELKQVGQSGEIDATKLLAVLNRLAADEDLKPAITSAVILVQSYVSVPNDPEVQARLKAIATAIALGLELALNDTK